MHAYLLCIEDAIHVDHCFIVIILMSTFCYLYFIIYYQLSFSLPVSQQNSIIIFITGNIWYRIKLL